MANGWSSDLKGVPAEHLVERLPRLGAVLEDREPTVGR